MVVVFLNDHCASNITQENEELSNSEFGGVIAFLVLAILGLFGNVVVMLVFCATREKQGLKMLVFTLTLTDLLVCVFIIPIDSYRLLYRRHLEQSADDIFNTFVVATRNSCMVFESALLILIAVERYCCVFLPHNQWTGSVKMKILIGSLLLVSTAIESAIASIHMLAEYDCGAKRTLSTATKIYYTVFCFGAMIIISIMYLRIGLVVHRRETARIRRSTRTRSLIQQRSLSATDDGNVEENAKGKISIASNSRLVRTTAMLGFATLIFYASLMPVILTNLGIMADGPLHRFLYINCVVNVVIYSFLSPTFRRDAAKACKCCRKRPT